MKVVLMLVAIAGVWAVGLAGAGDGNAALVVLAFPPLGVVAGLAFLRRERRRSDE